MSVKPLKKQGPEALPRWDLKDLFASQQALFAAARETDIRARAFERKYAGRLGRLSGKDFAMAIQSYEKLDEQLARMMSYASLAHAVAADDTALGKFYQRVQEVTTEISSHLIFFTLEINKIADADFKKKLKGSKDLQRWKPFLDNLRAFRKHQLSDEVEKTLHDRSVTGKSAWVRLFDETVVSLRFPVDGKMLTESETLHLMSDKNEARRKAAAEALGQVFGRNIRLFSLITNTLAKEKDIDDKQRKYARPVSYRNLSNQVEDEVVDALVEAVRKSYPRLSHRYYAIKAKWLGKKKLPYWDRNAPLPQDADSTWSWGEACDLVERAYRRFSPEMADILRDFFDKGWIDADPRAGKDSGAFSHPTVPSAHPYILMNWHGKVRDVMTLAHELGHGVHQVLSARQGHLMADTPLTLAETASVFGEMLTFQALLAAEKNPKKRKIMIAAKVEDMLNTVVRQIGFHQFETRVHAERKKGELTPDQISDIWLDVSREHLGPALSFDDSYRSFWAYIPHFVHTPFYVYSYAFADCLVNALYKVYQENPHGFSEKYLNLLRAGGTKRYKELLAPFGLNAADPGFWRKGLSVIEGFIDQLEKSV